MEGVKESLKRKHCIVCEEFYSTSTSQTCSQCSTRNPRLQTAIESNENILKLYKMTKLSYTKKQFTDYRAIKDAQACRDREEQIRTYNYFKILALLNDRQPWSLAHLRGLFIHNTRFTVSEAQPIFAYFKDNFQDDWVVLSLQIPIAQRIIDLYNLDTIRSNLDSTILCYYYDKTLELTRVFPNCRIDLYHADEIWKSYISDDLTHMVYPKTTVNYHEFAVSALWVMWNYRRRNSGNFVPADILKKICSLVSVGDWAIDDIVEVSSYNY